MTQHIPLYLAGVQIGSAKIEFDGAITLIIGSNFPQLRDLRSQIDQGLITALSIQPTIEKSQADEKKLNRVITNTRPTGGRWPKG